MKKLLLLSVFALASCGTIKREPVVRIETVDMPVAIPCPDKRLPRLTPPDTAENIAKIPPGDLGDLVKLLLEGRTLRVQQLLEDEAQIRACSGSPAK